MRAKPDSNAGTETKTDEGATPIETHVYDLPPSAKLVLKVLDAEGALTQQALAEETRLPQRTVRDATGRLVDARIVGERPSLRDARQSTYRITSDVRLP